MVGEEEGEELIQPFFHILLSSCPIPLPSAWLIVQLVFYTNDRTWRQRQPKAATVSRTTRSSLWSEPHSRGHVIEGPEWTSQLVIRGLPGKQRGQPWPHTLTLQSGVQGLHPGNSSRADGLCRCHRNRKKPLPFPGTPRLRSAWKHRFSL